jgi:hypothetical protein
MERVSGPEGALPTEDRNRYTTTVCASRSSLGILSGCFGPRVRLYGTIKVKPSDSTFKAGRISNTKLLRIAKAAERCMRHQLACEATAESMEGASNI